MYLNIEFKNGSNPWLCYGDKAKIAREVRKWKRHWTLEILKKDEWGIMAVATEKMTKLVDNK